MKNYFEFGKMGTSYRQEFIGGLTTFLAMAYILAVNPLTLSLASVKGLPASMHMDQGAVFVATAIASAIGSIVTTFAPPHSLSLAFRAFTFGTFFCYGDFGNSTGGIRQNEELF